MSKRQYTVRIVFKLLNTFTHIFLTKWFPCSPLVSGSFTTGVRLHLVYVHRTRSTQTLVVSGDSVVVQPPALRVRSAATGRYDEERLSRAAQCVVSLNLTDCRSAAELRREDSLVTLPAFDYYPCGAKQCCHLTDTG